MGGAFLTQPKTTKKTKKYQHSKLRVICSQMQGWRKYMEDAIIFQRISKHIFLFGVFDGHGGIQVAQYCSRHFSHILQHNKRFLSEEYPSALEQTFEMLDKMLDSEQGENQLRKITLENGLQPFEDGKVADSVGCTANVILMVNNWLYVANAGDSRAVLSREGVMLALSNDHKPDDEKEKKRISSAGGVVENGRINGHLNLSRSIGDLHYKRNQQLTYDEQMVISKPQIVQIELTKGDQFVIMGCDGVWQKYQTKPQGLIDLIREERCNGKDPQKVLQSYFDQCLSPDPRTQQLGCDNMSAILIEFNKLML